MTYPLYGSTFTLYRASLLYHGRQDVFSSLHDHARHLRDHLAGDRARTLLLTDLQPDLAGTGSLETCEWTLLGDEAAWERQQDDPDHEHINSRNARGLQIQLRFERANYTALLLGDRSKMTSNPGFTSLPLILIRMPATLRELFLDFLATTFDTRISPMRLRSSFLSSALEGLLEQTVSTEDNDAALNIESLSKGIGLQLSFPSVTPHLKSIDIVITKDDIQDFLREGGRSWQTNQTRSRTGTNWSTRPKSNITGPFTSALSTYLSNHAAFDLEDPAVVMSKVALGPFALAGEGKVKVLTSSTAAVDFWIALVQEAHGPGLESFGGMGETAPKAATQMESTKRNNTRIPSDRPSSLRV